MPVLVRNTGTGPAVFSDPGNNIAIEWQGSGDPAGGDVQFVPDAVADSPNFTRALQRGVFVIVDASAETQAKLDAQARAWQQQRETVRSRQEAVMDRQAESPISTVSIDEKGRVTHVPAETGKVIDGRPEETSIPVIIEERQRG